MTFRTSKKLKKKTRKPSVSRTLMACANNATAGQKAYGHAALAFATRMHAMGYDFMNAYCVYIGARALLAGAKKEHIKSLAEFARIHKKRNRSLA